MKSLRIFINRNARFSHGPNYLSNELRVFEWYRYPLQFLPNNFQGKNLIVFSVRHSMFKIKLGDGFMPKNTTTLTFKFCSHLTEIPDFSSISNLKKLTVENCHRLVKVHDSVGSLKNLSHLGFLGCSKLRILPRSLKLTSLHYLSLVNCLSLPELPEMECKMESLKILNISDMAVEELPLSIGNLIGLESLHLYSCEYLRRLPIALINLQHLRRLTVHCGTNSVNRMRDYVQSVYLPYSSNESTTLQEPNLPISFSHSESNFFPPYSFFTIFNSSATLNRLRLETPEIVSVPRSSKEFVKLTCLDLSYCVKLEEILELPPNIEKVDVEGCRLLERFSEISKVLEFNGSHIRTLRRIELGDCKKMHMNMWNDKVQNPLLWKGLYEYDATLFSKNPTPAWLSYVDEFFKNNEMVKEPGDYVKPRGEEEWTIDIEGPHYLEEISGIVLYVVAFDKIVSSWTSHIGHAKITSNNSNHVCCIKEGVELVDMHYHKDKSRTQYVVWVGYSNLQAFELKVLDNLRVQFDLYHLNDMVPFYRSCCAKVVYKNERKANKKRKIEDADVAKNPDQQKFNY